MKVAAEFALYFYVGKSGIVFLYYVSFFCEVSCICRALQYFGCETYLKGKLVYSN